MGSRTSRIRADREDPRRYQCRRNGREGPEKRGRSQQSVYLAQQLERRSQERELRMSRAREERVRSLNESRRREWDTYNSHRVRGEDGMWYF